jgi:hypothetical protein
MGYSSASGLSRVVVEQLLTGIAADLVWQLAVLHHDAGAGLAGCRAHCGTAMLPTWSPTNPLLTKRMCVCLLPAAAASAGSREGPPRSLCYDLQHGCASHRAR